MDKESIRAYYNSDDFADCYVQCLMEQADASFIPDIIKSICEKEYEIILSTKEAEKIFDYIYDNIDEFIEKFSNYYVGYCCVDSVNFGEQEEDLTCIYNPETGENYELSELEKIYEDAGFYVNEGMAYLDLSDEGIMIKITKEQVQKILRDEAL